MSAGLAFYVMCVGCLGWVVWGSSCFQFLVSLVWGNNGEEERKKVICKWRGGRGGEQEGIQRERKRKISKGKGRGRFVRARKIKRS